MERNSQSVRLVKFAPKGGAAHQVLEGLFILLVNRSQYSQEPPAFGEAGCITGLACNGHRFFKERGKLSVPSLELRQFGRSQVGIRFTTPVTQLMEYVPALRCADLPILQI